MTVDIQDLPHDTAYNNPFFEELKLHKLGRIHVGTPKPIAFTVGLHPVLTPEGDITHLALSHNSSIQPIFSFSDIVEILCHEYGTHFLYVVYEAWAIDSLLKFLPLKALTHLYEKGHLYFEGVQIWYTPGRKLTLVSEGKEARIHVIGTWSKRLNLRKACRRAGFRYADGDLLGMAAALKGLGDALLERVREFLGRAWGDLSTPSVLTKQALSQDLKKVDIKGIPEGALQMSYSCLHAPWIEIMAQGFFPKVYDYDLNSAYPSEIAKLIICDERAGEWIQSSEYVEGAKYGFAECIVTMRAGPGEVSPIRFRRGTGQLFSPFGMWVAYLTKGEIDFISKWKLGYVDILTGWWFVPSEEVHPFVRTVERLVELRRTSRDPVLKAMMKSVAVRMNGHFLQKLEVLSFEGGKSDWVAGPMFSPVYACEVMTQTKLKLAEMGMEATRRGGKVLAVSVDGLVTTVGLGKKKDRKLEAKSPAIIAAPLIMHLEDREGRYNLLKALWDDPNREHYKLGEDKRIEMREALLLGRPELIGKLEDSPIRIRVGADISRIWTDIPTRGEHLLTKRYYGKQPPIEYCLLNSQSRRSSYSELY